MLNLSNQSTSKPAIKTTTSRNKVSWLSFALLLLSSQCVSAEQTIANSLPQGGVVIDGTTTISQSEAHLQINQLTDKTIINWNSFDIGSQASVNFDQPDVNSIALNRVLGQNSSSIHGALNANGQVFLLNPNGILFGASSRVDVGGLVASTMALSDEDFRAGNYQFSGDSSASIINHGNINAAGGYVALLAKSVANEGIISARMGSVAFGSGDAMTLNLVGNQLISLEVDPEHVKQLITNSKLIPVAGDQVVMTASAAQSLIEQVIPTDEAEADTLIEEDNGSYSLIEMGGSIYANTVFGDAGDTGELVVSGAIDASDNASDGGRVVLSANTVVLADSASIDASGLTGGGDILIGGGFQGKNAAVRNAEFTSVKAGSKIKADAIESGNGGRVIVWADKHTQYQGQISVRGGSQSGDGGFVEVSGKNTLDFRGLVDTRASQGEIGKLLLDPYNMTIQSAGPDANFDASYNATATGSILTVSTLQTALDFADVTVTTGSTGTTEAGDITVANAIGWFSTNSLTLAANNDININANISTIDGNLTLTAGTEVDAPRTSSGDINIGNDVKVTLLSGNLIASAFGDIVESAISSGTAKGYFYIGGTSSFTAGGSVTLDSTSNRFTGTIDITSGGLGSISLYNNQVTTLGAIDGSGTGGVTIISNGILDGSSAFSSAGAVDLSTAVSSDGNINLTGAFDASGNVSLSADDVGSISIADINGALTIDAVSAGGAITLGNADTGALTFDSASGDVISGEDGAGGQASGIVTIMGSTITINDPIRTRGGNINLTSTVGAVTTISGAHIITTAEDETSTASGSVTVTGANGIGLQNVTTSGADSTSGVGSNASAVTLTATAGNIEVGAISATGGAALAGATANRNGGNAGSIILKATGGNITLNGDLSSIGGDFVGSASQGLGGYIKVETPVILGADLNIGTGITSGNIDLLDSIDSDGTSRSLTIAAGLGDVMLDGAIGSSAALTSLTVTSDFLVDIEKNVTTDGAAGVNVTTELIRLGDDDVINGSGTITINTLAGNGTVTLTSDNTYLDDAATFTRGSGAISITGNLYSNTSERNDLSFNGASGGNIDAAGEVGGATAAPDTKLGDIQIDTVSNLTFNKNISAASLVSLNATGRIYLGGASINQYYDGSNGLQLKTTGTDDTHAGDENIIQYEYVTLSEATAPITITAPNGALTINNDLTTAGGDITLNANTTITLSSDSDLTTTGGDIVLNAVTGLLSLSGTSDLNSSNGLISLTGVGVDHNLGNSVINAGSGKIRVDGGGSDVLLHGRLISSDNDTTGTPSVLISNAGGGGNAVSIRSLESQTGTMQVGLLAATDNLVAAQDLGVAGNLVLTTDEIRLLTAQPLTITSAGDDQAVTFTVTGTDAAGDPLVEGISGANAAAVTTTGSFKTITSIATDADTAGNVSVGLAADDSVAGSLYQYVHGSYVDNQIDINTLSAATTGSISITSTANIIDELSGFSVGSSLDVRAIGRLAGMALTGDVTATSVTIQTGTGVLALGTRDITATSGTILLQGRGVTQSAGSTVSATGTVTIYGSDYASQGTRGDITMAGDIISSSTSGSAVTLADMNVLTLPSIAIGNIGTRGGLRLGTHDHNGITYRRGYGAISQTAGSQLNIGALDIRQNGGSGAVDLSLVTNEIQTVGYVERGGAITLYDKDSEVNGLSLTAVHAGSYGTLLTATTEGAMTLSGTNRGKGMVLTAGAGGFSGTGSIEGHHGGAGLVKITTTGAMSLVANIYGKGLELTAGAGGFSGSGSFQGHHGVSAVTDLVNITTTGLLALGGGTMYGKGVQLSSGAAGITSAMDLQAHHGGGGDLILDAAGGNVTLTNRLYNTGIGNDIFITNANNVQMQHVEIHNGKIELGAVGTPLTGNVTQTGRIYSASNIENLTGSVSGSVTLNNTNQIYRIGAFTSGEDFSFFNQDRTLVLEGALESTSGNVSVDSRHSLTLSSAGSVTANTDTKGVTLKASSTVTGYTASIQGPVSAGSGGIVLNSVYGQVNNSGTGTLTTDGSVTVNSHTNYTINLQAAIAGDAGIDINSNGTFSNSGSGTLTASAGQVTIDSGASDATSIGAAVSSLSGIFTNSGGGFTNTGTLTSNGEITITSATGYATSIQNAISAGVAGNSNIIINSGGTFANNSSGTLTATGSVALKTYWDGATERNMTLAGNINAGSEGVKLTSSGTINQTAGTIVTTGTLFGPSQSGGTASSSVPSARGAITLSGANEVVNLGPFYLYDEAQVLFTLNDVSDGLTLAGFIENSHGAINLSTQGGALDLATYDIYAGGMATGGADITLSGQGISQSAGSSINTTGGITGSARTGANGGGAITLTGHDGTASGAIALSGGIDTVNASSSAIKIRGSSNLQLPNINAANGTLVLGDDTATIGLITGNITQAAATAIDVNSLKLGTVTNAIGGSAVLANSGNTIGQLDEVNVSDDGGTQYDLDINDSKNGLALTQAVLSAGGIRITTQTGGGSTGVLSLGGFDVLASGDIFLSGDTVTQATASTINADNSAGAATGGSIRVEGGGGANNITLEGTVTTDNSSSTAIEIVDAANVTLNVISAASGTVTLGVDSQELTGAVSQTETTGTISAVTLLGDAGVVTVETANIDNLGLFTATGALTLKEQAGAGTAGLKFTGTVTAGGTTWIETTDGILNLDIHKLDATANALTLKGVALSQQATSSILSTTADLYGAAGDIDLFSTLNDFTGQVTVHSTGSQVSVQDANQLSMNALTAVLDPTTSIKLWAGTQLSLTTENLLTTTGNIDFRSLGDILNTPGKLTTSSGDITLYALGTLSLAEKILSTSGDIIIDGATIASRGGAEDYVQTGGSGFIDITARSGNFTQGSDVLYKTEDGDITLTALNGNVTLANTQSTTGGLNVIAGGNILQLSGTAIAVDTIVATTKVDAAGDITLTESANNAANIHLSTLNAAGNTTVGGVIQYLDADGFAVQKILTTADTTLTALGAITADATGGNPGTVIADTFTVKTLLDAGAGVTLDNANDVNTLNIKVRTADDSAIAGETVTPTGTISFTDSDGFVVSAIETGGSTILTAGDAVTQTGAISTAKMGLSGTGSFTLNAASLSVPVNQVSTFASDASGAVNFTTQLALAIGAVNVSGITSDGADVSIAAPSIDMTGFTINTSSSQAGTGAGNVSLTSTGSGAAGNLTLDSIITSGTDAVVSSGNGGGVAGDITLSAAGDSISVMGAITARGGAGDGAGIDGADGTVKSFATAGVVSQADGVTEIDAGRLLLDALNTSSLLDTGNSIDLLAVKISGEGEGFNYRSGADYAIGGGEGSISGIATSGGDVDIGSSDVAISVSEAIITKGGTFTATGIRSFDSSSDAINTAGDITFASGVYKDGGDISITTTANNGSITTGALVASGDVNNAGDASSGAIILNADGILTIANTNALGIGTGTGGDVTLTGSEVHIAGSVSTSSTAADGGAISVNGPAVIEGGDRILSTGTTAGNISFSSSLNSDGTARGLSAAAGTGNVIFTGAVGNSAPLATLNIISATNVTASSTIDAASLTQQAGSGTTTLNGVTTLSSNLEFTGMNLTLNAAVDTGGTTTVTNAGLFTTTAAAVINSAGAVTQNGAGLNELAGDITTTNSNISFASGVTLTGDLVMGTDTGIGNISFTDVVDSDVTARDLTLNTGTGNATFTAAVGSTKALDSLIINSAGLTTFDAAVAAASVVTDAAGTLAINGMTVATSGAQTYNDNLALGDNTTLTATTVTTNGTVAGVVHSLSVIGDAVFGDAAADTVTGLTTLSVSGTTKINTDTITSADAQTYSGAVTVGNATTLSATDDPVLFSSTVDSEASEANDLTVSAGTGAITFTGAVGAALNGEPGAMIINSSGVTQLLSTVEAASLITNAGGSIEINGGSVTTSGVQTYGANVSLGANTTLVGSTITTNGTVSGADTYSLGVTGNAVFGDGAADTVTGLTTLAVSGTTGINTSNVTSSSTQVYSGDVTLGTDATLTGTTVTTNGKVVGASNGLDIAGNAVFGNEISDTVTGLTTLAVSGTTAVNTSTITSSSTQIYSGDVTLATNATLTGSSVTTNGLVIGASNSLAVTGNAVFGNEATDTVTGLTTLTVSGTSDINTDTVTSSGAQGYTGAVVLGADLTLNGVAVTFGSTILSDGTNRSLLVNDSGTTTFDGALGSSTATEKLTSLTTDAAGTSVINGGAIYTTMAQTFNDNITLGAAAALSGTVITTNGTVAGGANSLDITGKAVFGNEVTDTITGLTTLAVSGTTNINTSNITGNSTQNYAGVVTLGTDTTLTGAAITFSEKVISDGTTRSLTINDSGATTFAGAVGSATPGEALTSLITDAAGSTAINGGSVTTTAAQTYNDNVTLGAATFLTGTIITTNGTVAGGTNNLDIIGDAVFGDAAGDTVTGLDSLYISGTATINTSAVTSLMTQGYTGAVTIGEDSTLTTTHATVVFGSTIDSAISAGKALTVAVATGNIFITGDVGSGVNGELGALTLTGANLSLQNVTTTGAQTYNGDITTTNSAYTSIGTDITFNGNVIMNEVLTVTTGAGAGTITFGGTVDSETAETNNLNLTAGTGNIDFDGAIGTTDALGAINIASATNVTADSSITAASLSQSAGSGTTTLNGAVNTSNVAGVALTGTNIVVNETIGTTHSGTVTINASGAATMAAAGDINADGVVSITAGSGISTAGDITTSADNISLVSAVTLTGDVAISTGTTDGAISFGSTIDGDGVLARSLRLTSGSAAGQNFVAAVGDTNALNLLRIESAGVVTQGGTASIKAANIGIKSAGDVTLANAANDFDVLAALLSADAALVFVDSDGVEIGTVDAAALQIAGISDGAGTSNVSITVASLLSQAVSSPILIDGNLVIDSTAFDADDVAIKNISAGGTVLDNSLVAGDFSVDSTGDVTQLADANGIGADAWLQVGGSFDVTGAGSFVQGNSVDNLIGGGSGGSAANEIRLFGVITLSMVGADLVASATTTGTGETSTDTITAANLASGIVVTSDAGGQSISAVSNGTAISLNQANSIAGNIKITTKGTYSNSGTPVATGIIQSTALDLAETSLFVQQSTTNGSSAITGAGVLDLSNALNTFTGAVSAIAVGMDVHLREDSALELGTVNGSDVIIELADASSLAITQSGATTVTADTLMIRNAGDVTLINNNRVGTLAANLNGGLSLTNNQALTVGTVSAVNGVTTTNSGVTLNTAVGNLILDQAISVSGASDITLASGANFVNNVGASALVIGTGTWQIWSSNPASDTIGGLVPDFKQYNAVYGTTTVAGAGDGLLYTLAPELTVSLIGNVSRAYDGTDTATLAQNNYNIVGLITGDAAVLSTAGSYNDEHTGISKTVTVNPLSIASASASTGSITVYGYQLAAGSDSINANIGTITAAPITIGTSNVVKTYDSNDSALGTATVLAGSLFTDDSISGGSFSFADVNAGTGKTVNVSSVTVSDGNSGSNYAVTYSANTSSTINAYVLDLSGSRVYDGSTDAAASDLAAASFVGTETVLLSGTGSLADQHVGVSKAVSVGTLALADGTNGGLASNYTLAGGTHALTVTPYVVDLSGSRAYDGSTNAAASDLAAASFVGTETVLLSGTGSVVTEHVGVSKAVSVGTLALADGINGGLASNYTLTGGSFEITVTAAPITIGTSNVVKTYDSNDSALGTATVLAGSLFTDDSISGGSFSFADVNAGTGKTVNVSSVTVSDGNSGSNYAVTYSANTSSTINAYVLDLSGSRVYDGSTDAAASDLAAASFVGTETVLLSGTGSLADQHVGVSKAVSVGTLALADGTNGGLASNYTLAGGTHALTVTPYVVDLSGSRAYDGSTNAAASDLAAASFVGTETVLLSGTGSVVTEHVGVSKAVSVGTLALADGTNGGLASNYTLAGGTHALTVTPYVVDLSGSRVYDGSTDAAASDLAAASFVGTETVLLSGTGSLADQHVGVSKAVSVGTLALADGTNGGLASNYTLAGGTHALTVTPYVVDLSGSRAYDGSTNAAASDLAAASFVGTETVLLSGTGSVVTEHVGVSKAVSVGTLALADGINGGLASNYTLTGGSFEITVTAAPITIGTSNVVKTYDSNDSALGTATVLAGSLFTDDSISGGSFSFADVNAGTGKTVNVSSVTVSDGNSGSNYAVTYSANTSSTINAYVLDLSGSRVYDGSTDAAASDLAAASFVGTETVLLSGTGSLADQHVGVSKAVSVGTLALADGTNGGLASNYTLAGGTHALTVTPYVVDLSGSRAYDGSTNAAASDLAAASFVGTETVLLSGTGSVVTEHVGVSKAVSVGTLALADGINGGLASNYTLTGGSFEITVTAAPITIGTSNVVKTYDSNDSALGTATVLAGSLFTDDSISGGSFSFADVNAGTGKTVNVSSVTVSDGNSGSNYAVTYSANTSSTINAYVLDLSGSRVYDGSTDAAASDLAAASFVGTETVLLSGTGSLADQHVGVSKAVSVGTLALADGTNGGLASNYTLAGGTHALTVTPYVVDLSGSRAYDGSTDAAATDLVIGTLIGAETLLLSGTGSVADEHVAATKAVTLGTLALADDTGLASNYVLTGGTHALTVTPFVVNLSGTRVYDTTTDVAASDLIIGSLIGSETLNLTGSGSIADKHAGNNRAVTLGSLALSDGSGLATNYILSGGIYTIDITKQDITVAGVFAVNKTYDGTLAATINTDSSVLVGAVSGDDVGLNQITGEFLDKNIGSGKAINGTGFLLTGTDANEYNLIQPSGLTADITARTLLINASGVDKVYDGSTDATVTFTDDRAAADQLTFSYTASYIDKKVSVGKFIAVSIATSGVDAHNYIANTSAFTFAGITPKNLVLSGITAADKVYDGNTSATIDVSSAVYSGLVSGDDLSVSAIGAFDNKNIGIAKTVSLNSSYAGADVANYTITDQGNSVANVTARPLTISGITSADKVYDGNTTAIIDVGSAVYSGLVSGDDLSVSTTGSFDNKNIGVDKVVTLSSSYAGVDVANYGIVDQTSTTADVTMKTLNVSGISAVDKVYDGDTTSTVDVSAVNYTGLVSGDDLSVTAVGTFDNKNVGVDKVVNLSSSYAGADTANYNIVGQASTLANISSSSNSDVEKNLNVVVVIGNTVGAVLGSTDSGVFDTAGFGSGVTATAPAAMLTGLAVASETTASGAPDVTTSIRSQGFLKQQSYETVEFAAGQPFEYVVPKETFTHSDTSTAIEAKAKLTDGSPLPEWIKFDDKAMKFTGTPPVGLSQLNISVKAKDEYGNAAENIIRLNLINLLEGVSFKSGSAELDSDSYELMESTIAYLINNPETKFLIAGHTDKSGYAKTNLRLSQKRAEEVRNYFISKGVASSQLEAKGFGGGEPLVSNATVEGREANRRVELRMISKPAK